MRLLYNLLTNKNNGNNGNNGSSNFNKSNPIIVVSGIPRSGTSLMMKMLGAAKFDLVYDNLRCPDENNPNGYYEYTKVKYLKNGDTHWLKHARGKVIKIVSTLLSSLPPEHTYKIVFMNRSMNEIIASQSKMLEMQKKYTDQSDDAQMANFFAKHLNHTRKWIAEQTNMEIVYVNYNELLSTPTIPLSDVNNFLDSHLDIASMEKIINPHLYRNRHLTPVIEY